MGSRPSSDPLKPRGSKVKDEYVSVDDRSDQFDRAGQQLFPLGAARSGAIGLAVYALCI
jgi:hypothetical protein